MTAPPQELRQPPATAEAMMPIPPSASQPVHAAAATVAAPVLAYLALGANLGDARQAVRDAMQAIAAIPGVALLQQSPLYRTAPVDSSGPDYINAVVEVRTTVPPHDLLRALQAIEAAAGRQRPYRNAPRTLDIDILLYGDWHCADANLTVPHPRMGQRAFVLVPLADVAPQRVSAGQLQAVADQAIERLGQGQP